MNVEIEEYRNKGCKLSKDKVKVWSFIIFSFFCQMRVRLPVTAGRSAGRGRSRFADYYCFRIKTDMLREIWPNFAAFARVRSRAQSNAHLHLRSRVVRTWLEEGFNYKECAYVFRVHRVCRTSIGLSRGSELRRRRPNLAKFGMSVLILKQ